MNPGDKVTYVPYQECDPSLFERGIVKSIAPDGDVFVVYHCDNNWDRYRDYTAAKTRRGDLLMYWWE